jgi:hypothetical protein
MAEVVDYQAVLADLKAKRAGLDQAIAAIEQIIGVSTSTTPATVELGPGVTIKPGMFHGMSLTEAAVAYLRVTKQKRSIRDIADALEQGGFYHTSKDFTNTVRAVLARNAAQEGGEIVKDGTFWALAEWYRGRKPKSRKDGSEAEDAPTEGVETNDN